MKSGNREFEIVYSKSEMETVIESLKTKGYRDEDIHVMANDREVIDSAGSKGVHANQANSFSNRFKTLLSGKDVVRKELDRFNMSKERTDDYERKIEKGAVLLYTDGEGRSGEDENFSSFDDSNSSINLEEGTAGTPSSGTVTRHQTSNPGSDEIYAREVSREDQHVRSSDNDRLQDSRLKGDEIHPTSGLKKDEGSTLEKELDHEPALQTKEGAENLLHEEGVNNRQDEPSPGADPNLGPAPFGRDSEEEKLMKNRQGDFKEGANPHEHRDIESQKNKDDKNLPTQRLF
ncbi:MULTISPECIES: general stress protein [Planococcus]|uniref:General stress protein 17M-like domain-containing protein n=1 Tax=Planococcus faecalis TaxID=1598147 RepID=A0ABM6IU19_9BACL|nr:MULTISPECIES: general stress protein [Planococcus]AQU80078.1 hypothetical protein AJGP001_12670 [Planococcus faecalis]MDJ0330550.1 general stress protein [Planococcus sp. S3-L1]OHX52530.1 hypothetical protein BB777_03180 [Planococcus faecalis]